MMSSVIEVVVQSLGFTWFLLGVGILPRLLLLPHVGSLFSKNGFAINVPDVYQESVLRRYRSYSDVSIFHYYVPSQVTRATWEFAAFMDDPSCTPRQVHIHIQPGSYPVINPDNSTFPDGTYINSEQTYEITTLTKYQSHDALVFHAFNPMPGSWFAVAYIPDWNDDIGQQGLSHKCHYSLGSIASWSQHPDVMLISPHVPTTIESSAQYTFLKFFVPENIWQLDVIVTNCTIRALGTGDDDLCVQGFGLLADSLPFAVDVNISVSGTYTHTHYQPTMQTYYYVLLSSMAEISFTITVNMKECMYVWGFGPLPEPSIYSSSGSSLSEALPLETLPATTVSHANATSTPPPPPISSKPNTRSILMSRHSNQSVIQDWKDALHTENHTHVLNSTNTINNTLRYTGSRISAINHATDQDASEQECLPMISMARIKHAQDFMDSFLLQGNNRYMSFLGVSDAFPVVLKFELLPFVDIGGTLQINTRLVEPPRNALDQLPVVRICINHLRPPANKAGRIICKPNLDMFLSTASSSTLEAIKYFPFPRPGHWFVSFETKCYDANTSLSSLQQNGSEPSEVPCHFDLLMVFLNIRVQPCLFEGAPCGYHGTCEENHRGQFFFSTCRCLGGWKGWGCTDGSSALPHTILLLKTLLLTLSNIFFIPPVILAIRRRFYTESIVYTFTMFFSTFYHACDEELFAFCLMKYEVLQFCDFYSAILSFWVTLIAMADLPLKAVPIAHMIGALGIALGVEYQRTGLWVFIVPTGTGVIIMILSWGKKCLQSKACYPSRVLCLVSFVPGTLLVVTGLLLFAFVENESNYNYIHSVWHVIIALSIVFLLPRETRNETTEATDGEVQQQRHAMDDSELVDVSDYVTLTSDLQHLVH